MTESNLFDFDVFFDVLNTELPVGMEGGHCGEHGFWLSQEDLIRWNNDPDMLDANRLWTVVDGDDGELCICSGFHYVNRLAYLYTTESHGGNDIIFSDEPNMGKKALQADQAVELKALLGEVKNDG